MGDQNVLSSQIIRSIYNKPNDNDPTPKQLFEAISELDAKQLKQLLKSLTSIKSEIIHKGTDPLQTNYILMWMTLFSLYYLLTRYLPESVFKDLNNNPIFTYLYYATPILAFIADFGNNMILFPIKMRHISDNGPEEKNEKLKFDKVLSFIHKTSLHQAIQGLSETNKLQLSEENSRRVPHIQISGQPDTLEHEVTKYIYEAEKELTMNEVSEKLISASPEELLRLNELLNTIKKNITEEADQIYNEALTSYPKPRMDYFFTIATPSFIFIYITLSALIYILVETASDADSTSNDDFFNVDKYLLPIFVKTLPYIQKMCLAMSAISFMIAYFQYNDYNSAHNDWNTSMRLNKPLNDANEYALFQHKRLHPLDTAIDHQIKAEKTFKQAYN